jgi:hypothetical protein
MRRRGSSDDYRLSRDEFVDLRALLLSRHSADFDPAVESDYLRLTVSHTASLIELVENWTGSVEWVRNSPSIASGARFRALGDRYRSIRLRMTVPLVHVHLPKTAGTSINTHLAEHLDPERLHTQRPIRDILGMSVLQLMEAPFIACHGASLLRDVLPGERLYFTVLRDPGAQIWSHYNETRRAGLTIEEFEDWCLDPNNQNPQSRWLTMDWSCLRPSHAELHDVRRLGEDALLAEATDALEKLDLIGSTENLADLLGVIAERTGLPELATGALKRQNATRAMPPTGLLRSVAVREATTIDREVIARSQGLGHFIR